MIPLCLSFQQLDDKFLNKQSEIRMFSRLCILGFIFLVVSVNGKFARFNMTLKNTAFLETRSILGNFLRTHKCRHIYFDFGTNIGIQIRKLYEPALYPKAPVLPLFNEMYGGNNRSSVCAIGKLHYE